VEYTAPDTSTSEKGASSGIPGAGWDLACSIHMENEYWHLDFEGKPICMKQHTPDVATSLDYYQQDGFNVYLTTQHPIKVTNQTYTWLCEQNTLAADLLRSKRVNLSLRPFGRHLVVFEKTVVLKDPYRPRAEPREDRKGSLTVESKSGILCIMGTDIYHVKGDEKDLAIQWPKYIRLWDLTGGNSVGRKKSQAETSHFSPISMSSD
jgi:hypothetical protein